MFCFRLAISILSILASDLLGQANHIEYILIPEPSIDPAAAAQGKYLPGEVVFISVSLSATATDAPDIGLVQVTYYNSGPEIIDYNSDALVTGFPLTYLVNSPNSSIFAAVTEVVPSSLTIPASPATIPFMTFTAVAAESAGTTNVVDLLGDSRQSPTFVTTSDFTITWDNISDPLHNITGGVLEILTIAATEVLVTNANPPADNPFLAGQQPFRDVLQTGASPALTHGIGGATTPNEDTVMYHSVSVTFSATPVPAPTISNVSVGCTGTGTYPCPSVTAVLGTGAGPYRLGLSNVIPPGECTTFTFLGTASGQKLEYQSLPGDVNMDGTSSALDVLALVVGINDGSAVMSSEFPRADLNRNGVVAGTDVLRLVQLLNGLNTTQSWAGASVAPCPITSP